jgi:hypothetical protein
MRSEQHARRVRALGDVEKVLQVPHLGGGIADVKGTGLWVPASTKSMSRISPTMVQPNAVRDFNPPLAFKNQCPLGKHHLDMKYADLLTRDDHQLAEAAASNIDEYVAELSRIAASKAGTLKGQNVKSQIV